MSMVLQATLEGKGHELRSQMEELQGFIRTAAATGLAVHEVEQGLFKRLLALVGCRKSFDRYRWMPYSGVNRRKPHGPQILG